MTKISTAQEGQQQQQEEEGQQMQQQQPQQHHEKDKDSFLMTPESIARSETRVVVLLRITVLTVLLVTATFVSTGVYLYTRNDERDNFTSNYEDDALQVIDSFHELVERNIAAAASMSTAITSYALQQQQQQQANNNNNNQSSSFPFVTLPDFERHGSHLRAQSGSHIVHWMPLVTDEKRAEWERYALENRFHIDKAFQSDMESRTKQDARFVDSSTSTSDDDGVRNLQQQQQLNTTVLDDGSGYHPEIWRIGAVVPPGDEPKGGGPYLPLWQRSPVNGAKQAVLNMNFAHTRAFRSDIIELMSREKKALLNSVAVPVPAIKEQLEANLRVSQYRNHVEDYIDGLSTFLAYPVFDSFGEDKQLSGVLGTNIYWEVLFSGLHRTHTEGIIVVVENAFNQTFTYRIDKNAAKFIAMGDAHDSHFDHMELSAEVTEYLEQKASSMTRAYQTVSLCQESEYRIRVFPSRTTEQRYVTNKPVAYTVIVISGFVFVSILFMWFSYVVEKRQLGMVEKVIRNAHKATVAERELNEFLSHEVRNPLSAAISACSFVSTAVNEPCPLVEEETVRYVREDIEVVNSSLHFINDFLRSMLDIHRAEIKVEMSPTDVLRDVLEPVSTIIYRRVANFDVHVVCPENLIVMTDSIRLKQVILNLVRNASKFIERGFLRMRADLVDGMVRLYVEDSGPGISPQKRQDLFAKYQASLDLLSQGTGIGLNLSKKLMNTMNGDIWLDEAYDSGIEGFPGACFVVQLNAIPVDIESTLLTDSESDSHTRETGLGTALSDPELREKSPPGCSDSPPNTLKTAELAAPELPTELLVLLVDDDAVLRKLLSRGLKRLCPMWTIQEASSGETALRLCETEAFDLIFLDQYMASVDKQLLGTETAQAMRTKGVKSKICGLSANDLRDSFINAGADEFIVKPLPCKPVELKRILLDILSRDGYRDICLSV